MRPLEETLARWRETRAHNVNLEELRHEASKPKDKSPCISGCRSVCWKAFLLSKDENPGAWSQPLREARKHYATRRDHFLKFIKHPEALAQVNIDPLADDPDSPWNTVRQDEIIRSEILQDVQRLPDDANYHDDHIQSMILDILFVYCKQYPTRGGYRQGMHELLAPLVHVIEQDAIDATTLDAKSSYDELMLETLDANFIENDAYILFCQVMEHAQAFYEVKDAPEAAPGDASASRRLDQTSAIVERSKFIHEVCLQKVDPELAEHLTSVEVLPQIFLIRWIRLLFSREFPFDQFLALWDTIFAIDPTLDLVDLICVSMLVRIRWQLLEGDYSVCLQLLLKYPPPSEDHSPRTFVDDALYLRTHLDSSGGSSLITKYSGKTPTAVKSPNLTASPTPSFPGFGSIRQRSFNGRSPLPSPSRFLQQQSGMEALFQNAAKSAKGVLERGEKLGINQAVRDAMGELRRNVQAINENRSSPRSADRESNEDSAGALAAMQRRNAQLANMLNETVVNLKAVSTSDLEDKAKSLELIELAAAKIQFVQIYLEDPAMEMPDVAPPVTEAAQPDVADVVHGGLDEEDASTTQGGMVTETANSSQKLEKGHDEAPKPQNTTHGDVKEALQLKESETEAGVADEIPTDSLLAVKATIRPAPIPTRSTLAQSSFSWMLEPDESTAAKGSSATGSKSPTQHRKRGANASREKNAFLFGDVIPETEGGDPLRNDDIFGMQPIHKANTKS